MDEDDPAAPADGPIRTVEGRGRAALTIRGSEFVGHASPARSLEAATALLEAVREAHPDATHHVPAYRVRPADGLLREHASDAAEPTGSAGKPALGVLVHRELENVAVVVARFFGGTELGVGGLARAYAKATNLAVEDAGIVTAVPRRRLAITTTYDDSGTVRGILEAKAAALEATYAERVAFDALLPVDEAERVLDRIRSATSGRAEIEPGDTEAT